MHTVRLHLPWKTDQTHPLLRQTPGERGIWKNVQFYIIEGPEKCDYIVVFAGQHGLIREPLRKENTLFIAGEPPIFDACPQKNGQSIWDGQKFYINRGNESYDPKTHWR